MGFISGLGKVTKRILAVVKALVVLAIIGLVLFFVLGTCSHISLPGQGQPPSTAEAPWLIQTSSRVYYSEGYRILPDGTPQITGFWDSQDGSHWDYNPGSLEFPKAAYGQVRVTSRLVPSK